MQGQLQADMQLVPSAHSPTILNSNNTTILNPTYPAVFTSFCAIVSTSSDQAISTVTCSNCISCSNTH